MTICRHLFAQKLKLFTSLCWSFYYWVTGAQWTECSWTLSKPVWLSKHCQQWLTAVHMAMATMAAVVNKLFLELQSNKSCKVRRLSKWQRVNPPRITRAVNKYHGNLPFRIRISDLAVQMLACQQKSQGFSTSLIKFEICEVVVELSLFTPKVNRSEHFCPPRPQLAGWEVDYYAATWRI